MANPSPAEAAELEKSVSDTISDVYVWGNVGLRLILLL